MHFIHHGTMSSCKLLQGMWTCDIFMALRRFLQHCARWEPMERSFIYSSNPRDLEFNAHSNRAVAVKTHAPWLMPWVMGRVFSRPSQYAASRLCGAAWAWPSHIFSAFSFCRMQRRVDGLSENVFCYFVFLLILWLSIWLSSCGVSKRQGCPQNVFTGVAHQDQKPLIS